MAENNNLSLQLVLGGPAICQSGQIEFDSVNGEADTMVANVDGEIVRVELLGRGRIRLSPNHQFRYTVSFGVEQTIIGNITVEKNRIQINDNWSIVETGLRNHCLNNAMGRVPLIESDILHIRFEGRQFDTIGRQNLLRLRLMNISPHWAGIHFTPTELLEVLTNPADSMNDIEGLYHDFYYLQYKQEREQAAGRRDA